MGHYIDAEKLIAEVEKLSVKAENDEKKAFAKKDAAGHLAAVTKTSVYVKIKKLVTSLQEEQPEVDLEKEIQECWQHWLSPSNQDSVDDVLPKEEFAFHACHFYELGLNARKEGTK